MADGYVALEPADDFIVEHLLHQSHILVVLDVTCHVHCDSGTFLTSVLQRVEPEIYAPCYVFASRCVKAHYSALVVEFLCVEQWSLRVDPRMLLCITDCACLIMHAHGFSLRFFVLRSLHAHHPLCLYPSEYFCISFFDVAQVSPESVLVHLLIRLHIPESACVR